jgi:hypothetical protein
VKSKRLKKNCTVNANGKLHVKLKEFLNKITYKFNRYKRFVFVLVVFLSVVFVLVIAVLVVTVLAVLEAVLKILIIGLFYTYILMVLFIENIF